MTIAQNQQRTSMEKPQTFIEFINSGLPVPGILPAPQHQPEGTRAGLTFYYVRANFDADFPGLPVEGFENGLMPPGGIASIPHPLDQFSNNAYFIPGAILPGIQFMASGNHSGDEIAVLGVNFYGNPSKTAVANYFTDFYRILFDPPVQATGMDVQQYAGGGVCVMEVYDENGALLGSDVTAATNAGVFWGVASDVPIGEVRITETYTGAEGADNIAFGSAEKVPLSNYALYAGILLMVTYAVIRFRRII